MDRPSSSFETDSEPTSWWSRPCGIRDVLVLATPLIVSTLSWTIMNFIDRVFLLWYSLPAMAAAMPAGLLQFTLICFPLGLVSFGNTFVAQYLGAGQNDRIGAAVGQVMRLGLYCVPLFLVFPFFAPYFFALTGHDLEVISLEVIYFQVLMFGAGATVLAAGQATFFTGLGKTRVVMIVDSSSAAVNILLDYAWIFGNFGFAEMGIEGAAWATVVSQWWKVVFYFILMELPRFQKTYCLRRGRAFDLPLIRRLFRYGAPNGLQLFVDVTAITGFVMLIGLLGNDAMIATTMAFNVNSFSFVPIIGLGIAVSTMVGQELGRNRPHFASNAAWSAYAIALVYTGVMGLFYISTPDLFLMGHAAGVESSNFKELRDVTVVLLRFVAFYCLFDATAIVFVSVIKGAGDTRFVLLTTIVTSPMPLLLGFFGVMVMGWGLMWCWIVVTTWVLSLGVIYLTRFLQGRWKTMRVIEPDFIIDSQQQQVESADTIAV